MPPRSGGVLVVRERPVARREVLERRHLLEVGRDVRVVPRQMRAVVPDVDDVLVRAARWQVDVDSDAAEPPAGMGSPSASVAATALIAASHHVDARAPTRENGVSRDTKTRSQIGGVRRWRERGRTLRRGANPGVVERVT